VRAIGACYTYKQDELAVPAGLEARILQSTIGNVLPQQVRAPFGSRLVEWLRGALDPIVSPQLASVATMLLVAVFVLTNTVSTDGSVGGIYHASMQLAQQTAGNASKTSSDGVKEITNGVNQVIGTDKIEPPKNASSNQNSANQNSAPQNSQSKSKASPQSKKR